MAAELDTADYLAMALDKHKAEVLDLRLNVQQLEAALATAQQEARDLRAEVERLQNFANEERQKRGEECQKVVALRAAIRKHANAKGHDRCWLNDRELYAAIGIEFDPQLPPKGEFLSMCHAYYDAQCVQASPPACEGERVDIESVARELWDEVDAMKGHPYQQIEAILRRHWPTAPKPAAGGEDYSLVAKFIAESPANAQAFLDEQAKVQAEEWDLLKADLASANQRADAADEAFSNAQTALVQTGEELREAKQRSLNNANKYSKACDLLREISDYIYAGPLGEKIRSFLTTKESGDEVPVQNQGAGEVPAAQGLGAEMHLPVADSRYHIPFLRWTVAVDADDAALTGPDDPEPEASPVPNPQPAQALPADDGPLADVIETAGNLSLLVSELTTRLMTLSQGGIKITRRYTSPPLKFDDE